MTLDAATFTPAVVAAAGGVPDYVQPTVSLDSGPMNVADKRLQRALAEERFPYTILTTHRSEVGWAAAVSFVEKSAKLEFEAEAPMEEALFATADDVQIVVGREEGYGAARWSITVAGTTRAVARKWADAFAKLLPAPIPPPPPTRPYDMVPVRFWMQNPYSGEATSRHRDIQIHEWAKVSENYSAEPRAQLDSLMSLTAPSGGKLLLMHGEPGSGKAQPHDAKILTPTGWTTMGEIAPDDLVCTPDGQWARVKAKYPQGEVPIYRVTFSDGSSTRCCGEHLWAYQTRNDRKRQPSNWRVESLEAIADRLVAGKDNARNVWIPMVESVSFAEQEPLPIDPYVLGVLIGDGYLRPGDTSFTKPDAWMAEEVTSLLDGVGTVAPVKNGDRCSTWSVRGINPQLGELGLMGKRSLEKFIPPQYLTASEKDRRALLAGLLDTDGHADGVTCEWSTSSPQLAKDFAFLVQSLGCTFAETVRIPHYTHNGEKLAGAPSHRFHLCPPVGMNPFRMPRKADAFRPRSKYRPRRAMVAVEYVGMEEASCIAVDHPDSLYITDDFIVTHNTRAILTLLSEWREWCAASVITDPEKFLGDVTYMNSLVFGAAGNASWLLLVIEDGDEFMNVKGRDSKGQSIARLLNLGDGIVGQGLNLLTLITTNVDVEDLNPAVTRNGRCMANIKVGALTADEAGAWLSAKGYKGPKPSEPMTLADMYAKLAPKH